MIWSVVTPLGGSVVSGPSCANAGTVKQTATASGSNKIPGNFIYLTGVGLIQAYSKVRCDERSEVAVWNGGVGYPSGKSPLTLPQERGEGGPSEIFNAPLVLHPDVI